MAKHKALTDNKNYITLKQRVKDKHAKKLMSLAREVNLVFNFVNDLSHKHIKREKKFLSAFDINEFTKGCTDKSLGEFKLNLHSQTIQAINEEYVLRRQQFKKAKLNWRVSSKKSSKYSLGWIPFKSSGIQVSHGQVKYAGAWFSIWDSYHINQYKDSIKSGSFVEDARGRWYVCMVVDLDKFHQSKELNENNFIEKLNKNDLEKHTEEINPKHKNCENFNQKDFNMPKNHQLKPKLKLEEVKAEKSIGIDLGLKDFATISNGLTAHQIKAAKNYRKWEDKLAKAQRAKNQPLVRTIHAKIKNTRKDEHHKLSRYLVDNHQAIFVGDVSSSKLSQTKMAKSVLDAGWYMFKNMLEYKCKHAGIFYVEVSEKDTTRQCSSCGAITGPQGVAGLGIREWSCTCGAIHQRDVNAANNILVRGHTHLARGILSL